MCVCACVRVPRIQDSVCLLSHMTITRRLFTILCCTSGKCCSCLSIVYYDLRRVAASYSLLCDGVAVYVVGIASAAQPCVWRGCNQRCRISCPGGRSPDFLQVLQCLPFSRSRAPDYFEKAVHTQKKNVLHGYVCRTQSAQLHLSD